MLPSKLKQVRTQVGLPIVGLAVRAGASAGTIIAIERHGHTPRPETKQRLADALGVSVESIWPSSNEDGNQCA